MTALSRTSVKSQLCTTLRPQVVRQHVRVFGDAISDRDFLPAGPDRERLAEPVSYGYLPEEQAYLVRPCACGCGDDTDRDFLAGHDVRAIQQRVRDHVDGSALKLIQFLDQRAAA